MKEVLEFFNGFGTLLPIIRTIIIVLVFYILFKSIFRIAKKAVLKRATTKKQKSNVEIFSRLINYLIILILILFAIFSYTGSWAGLGIGVGLMTAALGWALQRPITGIAAWIMIVVKRPFEIGDRIIVGKVRGDVKDITLTHVYLEEIGGLIGGEENSGRIILVPNSKFFELNIINYTSQSDFVLDQVAVDVTYESDLEKAKEIALAAANKLTKDVIKETKEKPYIRAYFGPSGINMRVRYYSFAKRVQEISSAITQEIFAQVNKTKKVEIAYPHTEVLFRKKTKK